MFKKIPDIWKDISCDDRWFTISNILTFIRILLVPVIVIGISYYCWRTVFVAFLIAVATDMLDGYLARLLHEQTVLGSFLDPIADKLLLLSSFISLAFVKTPAFSIPYWFVWLVIARELIILGGTFFLLLLGVEAKINPSVSGKMTTFFQSGFILWLLSCYFLGWNPVKTYTVLIIMLALFSIISLGQYGIIGLRYLCSVVNFNWKS